MERNIYMLITLYMNRICSFLYGNTYADLILHKSLSMFHYFNLLLLTKYNYVIIIYARFKQIVLSMVVQVNV